MKKNLLFALLLPLLSIAQNTCETALAITPGLHTTGVIDGTNVSGSTVCWGSTGQIGTHAEWYAYIPAADGMARINTNLPANDGITLSNNTKVSVNKGTCGALECLEAEGQIFGPGPFFADVTFEVRAGVTYYISFDNYWSNKGLQFELTLQTPVCDNTVPFTEDFATQLGFTCWKTYNGVGAQKWTYHPYMNLDPDPQFDPVAVSYPLSGGPATPKNQWLVSPALQLEAGTNYAISVKYNALHFGGTGPEPNESFRTVILSQQDPAIANETELGQVNGIIQQGAYVPPYNSELATTVTYNFTPAAAGDYYVGLHSISPATVGALLIYEVKVNSTLANEEFEKADFNVYPVPVTSILNIENSNEIIIKGVEVADLNGRVVLIDKPAGTNARVDVSGLASGVYLLNVIHENGIYTQKIIR